MPVFVRGFFSLLGRLLLVGIFLSSAPHHIQEYQGTLGYMESQHVPYPQVLLPGALAFMILGGLSVLVGYHARIGALLLFVFLGLAAYCFHNFWDYAADPKVMQNQMIHFSKNVSMAGAMLFVIGNGPGYWSIDGPDVVIYKPPASA
jgi:putative oxidoreductase